MSTTDTCELLVLDRSFDSVAPVVHEWTYETLLFDVCAQRIKGNIIRQTYDTTGGKKQERRILGRCPGLATLLLSAYGKPREVARWCGNPH